MWIIVRILLLQDLKHQEQVTITNLFSLAVLHLNYQLSHEIKIFQLSVLQFSH